MLSHQIYEIYRQSSKNRANYKKLIESRVRKICRSSIREEILQYPTVYSYLIKKFPQIDISDIPIFRADPETFKKAKWANVGGLFIPWKSIILIKDVSLGTNDKPNARSVFEKELSRHYLISTAVEDVIVHECLHAISFRAGRASSRFRHMEEEFVYTNCIDFYKERGMNVQDIVEYNFLPFCMQDVLSNRDDFKNVLEKAFAKGIPFVDYWSMSRRARKKFENTNAELLVSLIVEKAREKGNHMIECYNRYGHGISLGRGDMTDKSVRFASINVDCDL